jgi:hypothetical protein
MQSNAKHKFECYKGQGAGNRMNSMVIVINPKIFVKKNKMNMELDKKE